MFLRFLIGTGVLHKGTWRLDEGISEEGDRGFLVDFVVAGSISGTLVGGDTSTKEYSFIIRSFVEITIMKNGHLIELWGHLELVVVATSQLSYTDLLVRDKSKCP